MFYQLQIMFGNTKGKCGSSLSGEIYAVRRSIMLLYINIYLIALFTLLVLALCILGRGKTVPANDR